jgi:tetratricopeptide (TPR) repeat protein
LHLCALAALALAAPAEADWYQASSEHFLIYSEQKPDELRAFAENLEKFDSAVRAVRGMDDMPLSQGNRLTIFTLHNAAEVQRLANDKSGTVAGFYKPRAVGPIAFVARGESSKTYFAARTGTRIGGATLETGLGDETILLHEYSHHLMMQNLAVPYPEWLVEGFAEFMSTAQFETDGSVGLGLPATHRFLGLLTGQSLPLETLLSGRYDKINLEQRESVYGHGWLLTHYLTFEPSRKGQLAVYLTALARGADPLDAARQTFGDLEQLDRDLDAYLHRPKLQYVKISGTALTFAPIQISRLSMGGSAVVPLFIEVKNGVSANTTESLAQQVRAVEVRFPGDELVETTLAEAELDANHPEAAEAAADRALKADPRAIEAQVLNGRSIAARAAKAQGPARAVLFAEARAALIDANKADPEDPEPLMEYYEAFVRQGIRPTANAIAALHYASDLAPQDVGLRMTSATAYLTEGKTDEARRALVPVAYNPHGEDLADIARRMIAKIDAGDARSALAVAQASANAEPDSP